MDETARTALGVILLGVLIGSWIKFGAGWTFLGFLVVAVLTAIGWRLTTGHWPTNEDAPTD